VDNGISLRRAEGGALGVAKHVAIVSDGNARWAQARGLSIAEGHAAAADTVIARVLDAVELGIEQLTLYAFSTENWSRPAEEVRALVGMLAQRITRDTPVLDAHDVRIAFIGRRDRAGPALSGAMADAELKTRANTGMSVYVAFDYGGREEILSAASRYRGGGEREFAGLMFAPEMRDPDLLIRTSGEQRISNFLLWQAAYAELMFRQEMWPDFSRECFEGCLAEYRQRERRYGGRASLHAAPAS
jgi:undecaprenyl diphosphate synthase